MVRAIRRRFDLTGFLQRWKSLRELTDGRPADLQVADLDVYYGPVPALRGVSLEVRAGEAVAILGANGAGKTTLLQTISGILRPRRGEIRFAGAKLDGRPAFDIARSGLVHVPEGRRVFSGLTVLENLQIGGAARRDRSAVHEDMEWMFDVFPDLHAKRYRLARELSGGQQQMLAIARGLMPKPRLLCLDEPSLGLSPRMAEHLTELVERIRQDRQIGILMVEQNAGLALAITERAYVMQRGQITQQGTSPELLSASDLRAAYLGGEQPAEPK